MAVLETIRNKFGILITVLIAIALLSFIVDPSTLINSTQSSPTYSDDVVVAEINGHDVYYSDFRAEMDKINTNQDKNFVRNNVLRNFIFKYLYLENAINAGFVVSDKEMAQILSGNINSDFVLATLGPMNKERLAELESDAKANKNGYAKVWESILHSVKNDRYMTKYTEYLRRSSFENPLLTENDINNRNLVDVEFIMIPFSEIEGDVVVSDSEIVDYYNTNKAYYKYPENRNVEYVCIELDPEDETISDKIDSVFTGIENIDSFRKAVIDNGYESHTQELLINTNNLGDINNTFNITKWAFDEEEGSISPVLYVYDNDKSYAIISYLDKVDNSGYVSLDKEIEGKTLHDDIKEILEKDKKADMKLAEITEKVKGLDDIDLIADELGVEVSSKENVAFASNDLDPRFAGALSVAEEGIVNVPFKGSNGIYIYKVNKISKGEYYTDGDAYDAKNMTDEYYIRLYNNLYMNPDYVKDYTILYF